MFFLEFFIMASQKAATSKLLAWFLILALVHISVATGNGTGNGTGTGSGTPSQSGTSNPSQLPTNSTPTDDDDDDDDITDEFTDYNPFSYIDDIFYWFLKSNNISPNPNGVRFYLYNDPTNCFKYCEIVFGDIDSVRRCHYNAALPLIAVTHGFMGDGFTNDSSAVQIKTGYCNAGYSGVTANVIVVDWSRMSGPVDFTGLDSYLTIFPVYCQAAYNVDDAANRVGAFLQFLNKNNFLQNSVSGNKNVSKVHMIGHSLGAHVMGLAAKNFTGNTGIKIQRLTGTDPAAPLWRWVSAEDRFSVKQAEFVDVVHTNGGGFAMYSRLGDVDFYVNGGGRIQPVCRLFSWWLLSWIPIQSPITCSHQKAPEYFALSITNRNIAATCKRQGKCNPNTVKFGEAVSLDARGRYSVDI